MAATGKTPTHLWIVGIIALLWNSFGAVDYTLSQMGNIAYLDSAGESVGISGQEMLDFIKGFPTWMHAFWALGVWGALGGAALLLMRSRFAVWAFALSLLGLAVTSTYRFTTPQPEWAQGGSMAVREIIIWSVATFLLIYAISMKNKGVLR